MKKTPSADATKRKMNNKPNVKKGESSADWIRIPSLGINIAERGMPMIATPPRIRLHDAKGWSLRAFFICSILTPLNW